MNAKARGARHDAARTTRIRRGCRRATCRRRTISRTLVRAAAEYPLIREYSTTPAHYVEVQPTGQTLGFNNSNALVKNGAWDIQLQKTGYIREAGRCVVMLATIASRPLVIVLLDSLGKYTRLGDAQRVKHWLETGESLPAARCRPSAPQKPQAPSAKPRYARRKRRSSGGLRGAQASEARRRGPPQVVTAERRSCASSPRFSPVRGGAARSSSFACARVLAVTSRAAEHPRQLLDAVGAGELRERRCATPSPLPVLVTRKCASANAATCGRCVTHSTCRRAPSVCSRPPTVAATAPPMPLSTSSNTSVGHLRRLRSPPPGSRARCATARRRTRRAPAAPAAASDGSRRGTRPARGRSSRASATRLERDLEPAAGHRQRLHGLGDPMRELVGARSSRFFDSSAAPRRDSRASASAARCASACGIGGFGERGEPRLGFREQRGQRLGPHAMLARHVVDRRQPLLDALQLGGIEVEPAAGSRAARARLRRARCAAGSSSATTSASAGSCATARKRCDELRQARGERVVGLGQRRHAVRWRRRSARRRGRAAIARRERRAIPLRVTASVASSRRRCVEELALRGGGVRRMRGGVAPLDGGAPRAPAVGDFARQAS